jgi:hypothetical protein
MKVTAILLVGFVAGLIAGYWLHSTMSPPLGSHVAEHRVLTRDVDIGKEFPFAPNQPPLTGTLKKGSTLSVVWRKSTVVYVRFSTAVTQKRLSEISVEQPELR